jgi:uncharacterized membrane protein YhaH (DUF805 family)
MARDFDPNLLKKAQQDARKDRLDNVFTPPAGGWERQRWIFLGFEGHLARSDYDTSLLLWFFALVTHLSLLFTAMGTSLPTFVSVPLGLILAVASMAIVWSMIALGVKRLRDAGLPLILLLLLCGPALIIGLFVEGSE